MRFLPKTWGLLFLASALVVVVANIELTSYLKEIGYVDDPHALEFREAPADWILDQTRRRAEYVVRSGDTVCGIAQRWGMDCRQVEEANSGRYGDQFSLPLGMRLYLPLGTRSDSHEGS